MALVYRDCVKQLTSSTDIADLALDSSVLQGYRSFDDALSDGDQCYYLIDVPVTEQWELGLGTFSSPSTLSRTTILKSSNANSKIDLIAGTFPEVSIVAPSHIYQDIRTLLDTTKTSLVAEYEVTGSPVSAVTFNDLDLNSDIGYTIELQVICGTTGTGQICHLQINGDSTQTNYTHRYLYNYATTALTTGSHSDRTDIAFTLDDPADFFKTTIEMTMAGSYPVWNATTSSLYNSTYTTMYRFYKYNNIQTNVTSLRVVSTLFSPVTTETVALGVGTKIRIYRWLV